MLTAVDVRVSQGMADSYSDSPSEEGGAGMTAGDEDRQGRRGGQRSAKDFEVQPTPEERRRVRAVYRELIAHTEGKRNELESEQLVRTIQKANELFQQVYTTQEATLDSRLLVTAAELGVQKAQRMRLDGGSFNVDDWIGKLVATMSTERQLEEEDEEYAESPEVHLDWYALGQAATRALLKAPTIDFMLGPLAVEPKIRNQPRKVAKLVKNKEDLQRPQQLKESDFDKQENETTTLVFQIAKRLHEVGNINFFTFIVNPESFGQTVENLFYLSFLIRDGKVQLNEDEEGELILEPAAPPRPEDYEDNEIKRYQAVVDIDMATWRALIDAYNIRQSCIPTRPPSTMTASGGRWYG
ncbi:Smc5-Smc6 complex subunit NSE4 [Spizellomyces punctatus DAOM BR117]|uniref:Non-structural maintenance of chromosomes element 4 n=1 Tax=Spizellomyces punctatus (strain DAOM BR117) TaxID=645134 RepID=A0A0L0HFN9_SPIPD|nr:Smc5-Smc6 complex subunit NSE4 [Spizellomyces punctatus DAOM BR117]KNC99739.1 hypothetical protein SPPG_05119 [Spizellomyces punctatus DAOM BR117]|eukprot:XP_016607779.1 hypothetical protein SPPG_05119 [Spizellomyces punctatus DAOM BR117]